MATIATTCIIPTWTACHHLSSPTCVTASASNRQACLQACATKKWPANGLTVSPKNYAVACSTPCMKLSRTWQSITWVDLKTPTIPATGKNAHGRENPSRPSTSWWTIWESTLARNRSPVRFLAAEKFLRGLKIWRFTKEYIQVCNIFFLYTLGSSVFGYPCGYPFIFDCSCWYSINPINCFKGK